MKKPKHARVVKKTGHFKTEEGLMGAEKPNEKRVTDITEFNVGGEKVYLSSVMDLFSGEAVSYRI